MDDLDSKLNVMALDENTVDAEVRVEGTAHHLDAKDVVVLSENESKSMVPAKARTEGCTFARILLFHGAGTFQTPTESCNHIPDFSSIRTACTGMQYFRYFPDQNLVAILYFCNWNLAAEAIVVLWKLHLQGKHVFVPEFPRKDLNIQDYKKTVDNELREIFLEHLLELQNGKDVENWKVDLEVARDELSRIRKKLKARNRFDVFSKLTAEEKDVTHRIKVMNEQLSEYLSSLKALEFSISETNSKEQSCAPGDAVSVLKLGDDWSWHQVHCLIERETHRFRARLPIYAKRSQILQHIQNNQVLVLSAETGSGKSTQLVQYMVDAGFVKDGFSVVCTQPRKLATLALCQRVSKECRGCVRHNQFVDCLTGTASRMRFFPKILYATDHSLLQLLLVDEWLTQFACVIVDEVHERSLNTDILLAMLKRCLPHRPDLKVVIMSASADTALLCSYFGGCAMFAVMGRSFPVQFIYVADEMDDFQDIEIKKKSLENSQHVLHTIQVVKSILSRPDTGDVLAFLTSQTEVEWACSQNFGSSAIVLSLHGKMQAGEQHLVFKPTPNGMRKIVFATNIAETSLTIPGIKFVVDCGLAKESSVDSWTGMNILKLCKIDKSAAMQRAGRAGRTESGICYRLYSKLDFEAMETHRMPEIMRVNLGVAVLKLMALGIQNIETFDFIDTPDPTAVAAAVTSLYRLDAIDEERGRLQPTLFGSNLVKLGLDPRLGFIVLRCISAGLGMEGLVIAGLLSSPSSVFFRAGSDDDKLLSDCLKMRFCHPLGDIFTLLSVYREWVMLPRDVQTRWCVENSINAKSMRRCRDFVMEIEQCLRMNLGIYVSQEWTWSVKGSEKSNEILKKIIVSSMRENIAVFSGHEAVGYDIVGLQKQAFVHPSSSLAIFGHTPSWVVFGELFCTSQQFLTLVTIVEPEWLCEMNCLSHHDIAVLDARRMNKTVISDLNSCLLSRICGKFNVGLKFLTRRIQQGNDDRCILEACYENEELRIYATMKLMKRAETLVQEAINREKRLLENECVERYIFHAATGKSSSAILFGSGAEIKHLLMPGEYASIQVSNVDVEMEDEDVLSIFDKCAGGIAGFRRDPSGIKWGTVTFCSTMGASEAVTLLNAAKVGRCLMQVTPLITSISIEKSRLYTPAVTARLAWARRQIKGFAIVRCKFEEQDQIIRLCSRMVVNGYPIVCKPGKKEEGKVVIIHGITSQVTESKLREELQNASGCILEDIYFPRLPADLQPTVESCLETLIQEVEQFVPRTKFKATVTGSHSDFEFKAILKFEENQHENAAKAISYLNGHVLSVCKPWQTINCEEKFYTSVQCSGPIYNVLRDELCELIMALMQQMEGAEMILRKGSYGCFFIHISANNLSKLGGCKSALEKLIEGMIVDHTSHAELKLIFTRAGLQMAKSIEIQTRTLINCEKRSRTVRIYGSSEAKSRAFDKLVGCLLQLKERKKCHEILLRQGRPCGLMREIVRKFGVDLAGLQRHIEGVDLSLDLKHHKLLVFGSKENISVIEKRVHETVLAMEGSACRSLDISDSQSCGICLCEVEDSYSLVGCSHKFCRECVRGQILSAIQHREGFPLICTYPNCSQKLLLADFQVLLTKVEEDELASASLSAFVSSNSGKYRFCKTPDCPSVYRITDKSQMFTCGICSIRLCTCCHHEYHSGLSCQEYEELKQDPDLSLKMWRKGKQHVQSCPSCGSTIEKVDGCNHVLCKCSAHLCWICCSPFKTNEDCYLHLQNVHGGYV